MAKINQKPVNKDPRKGPAKARQAAPKGPRKSELAGTGRPELSAEAETLKEKILAEFDVSDAAGLSILDEALAAFDLCRACEAEIAEQGMTTTDRFYQKKAHPLLSTLRDARSQFLGALKQLGLDLEPVRSGPGRPPGR